MPFFVVNLLNWVSWLFDPLPGLFIVKGKTQRFIIFCGILWNPCNIKGFWLSTLFTLNLSFCKFRVKLFWSKSTRILAIYNTSRLFIASLETLHTTKTIIKTYYSPWFLWKTLETRIRINLQVFNFLPSKINFANRPCRYLIDYPSPLRIQNLLENCLLCLFSMA